MILLGNAENGAVKKPDAPKAHPAECKLLVFEAFLNRPASLKNF